MITFFILSHKFRRIAAEKAPAGSLPLTKSALLPRRTLRPLRYALRCFGMHDKRFDAVLILPQQFIHFTAIGIDRKVQGYRF